MSVKRSKTKRAQRSSEVSSSYSSSSSVSSSDEETDARDLKSIKEYLSNRKELASQLFKSVKADKIRMMLPQILKKMDLNELEELCANELSGMSKSRIFSIINGQQMLESSDTNESDDSGPSLEIISDTEEWLTDDSSKKDDHSRSTNINLKSLKDAGKTRNKSSDQKKSKSRVKTEPKDKSTKSKEPKVKIEGEKPVSKEKEGDSLLDLLELEMRARAIRALIRKEEDITPTTSDNQNTLANATTLDQKISAVKQRVINELNPQQLENMIKQTDDEDVVLVVEPMPTIELLSTDSENEEQNQRRVNQKLENEDKEKENVKTNDIVKEKEKDTNKQNEMEKKSEETRPYLNDSESEKTDESFEEGQLKEMKKKTSDVDLKKSSINKEKKEDSASLVKTDEKKCKKIFGDQEKVAVDANKIDMEEIIDLDDYSDDIDDTEDSENRKSEGKVQKQKSDHSETWATRYYKTDDVQSVIKESKIQSEIRKRLRERQRLCKVNKSPTDLSPQAQVELPTVESSPIGSVQEYLALKATMSSENNEEKNVTVDDDLKISVVSSIHDDRSKDDSASNNANAVESNKQHMQVENVSKAEVLSSTDIPENISNANISVIDKENLTSDAVEKS